jgi:hypothetical protein
VPPALMPFVPVPPAPVPTVLVFVAPMPTAPVLTAPMPTVSVLVASAHCSGACVSALLPFAFSTRTPGLKHKFSLLSKNVVSLLFQHLSLLFYP